MNWSTGSASTFEHAPLGTHFARFIGIIDLGTQEGEYQGKKTIRRQNLIQWELPNELMESGKPFTISKFYTANIRNEKANLRIDVVALRGGKDLTEDEIATFDPKSLLGQPCQVMVTKKEGSDKHTVSGLAGVPKGVQVPAATNNLVFFDLDNFSEETFDGISEGLKKMIVKSPEYANIINGEFAEPETKTMDTSDIPF